MILFCSIKEPPPSSTTVNYSLPVADPRLNKWEGVSRQPQRVDANLSYGIIFVGNCMKMKTIGLRGGACVTRALDFPLPYRMKCVQTSDWESSNPFFYPVSS